MLYVWICAVGRKTEKAERGVEYGRTRKAGESGTWRRVQPGGRKPERAERGVENGRTKETGGRNGGAEKWRTADYFKSEKFQNYFISV